MVSMCCKLLVFLSQVELLVMKALSLGLVKGKKSTLVYVNGISGLMSIINFIHWHCRVVVIMYRV